MLKKSTLSAVLIAMVAITSSAVLVVSETTRRAGRTAFAAAPTSQPNLAGLLRQTNRPSEVEPLLRRALAIDEKSYGSDHPEVATDLNNLAGLLRQTNRPGEAEPLVRRALAIAEKSYGPDHPKVATALNNLAELLRMTNRLPEAEPLTARHWRSTRRASVRTIPRSEPTSTTSPDCCEPPISWPRRNRSIAGRWR